MGGVGWEAGYHPLRLDKGNEQEEGAPLPQLALHPDLAAVPLSCNCTSESAACPSSSGVRLEPELACLFSNWNWSGVNVLHVRQLRSALWVYRSDRKI